MQKCVLDSADLDGFRLNVVDTMVDDNLKAFVNRYGSGLLTSQRILAIGGNGSPVYDTDASIEGAVLPQGSNLNGFPIQTQAKFTHTLFTPDPVLEGDLVADNNGDSYIAHASSPYWAMGNFAYYMVELFKLQTATLKRRISGGESYFDSTIYMNLAVRGQSSLNPQEYYGVYDYVGVTLEDVLEGDQIVDNKGNSYVVMQSIKYPFARKDLYASWTVVVLVKMFPAVTLRTLTLGDTADSVTGIFPPSYAESTVYMQIFNPSKSMIKTPAGYYGKYDFIGLTSASVLEGDQVTYNGTTYEVTQVSSYPTARTDITLTWKVLGLTKRDFTTQPATSGTWHVDSTSVKTDPRNRIKTVIDTYLTAANIKKDDGTTNASTVTCFDGATYPITRLFLTKTLDALAVIRRGNTTILYTDKLLGRKPYATEEQVFIHVYAVNKSTITATNLAEKYENEIKRILTTYDPYTNVRDLEGVSGKLTDLGYGFLYETVIEVNYKRANDDYTAALPTITYGDNQGTTYYFPNATDIKFTDPDTGDVRMLPPGRIGDYLQILGSSDFEVTITADIDIDASNKTWKRPQASTPKTDTVNWQVFSEIKFGNKTDAQQVYQNLNWGGGTTIPVRLTDFSIDGSVITLTFRRYTASNASSGTSAAWYGIS